MTFTVYDGPPGAAPTPLQTYGQALQTSTQLFLEGVVDDLLKANIGGQLKRLFEQTLFPLIERLGYLAQTLLNQVSSGIRNLGQDLGAVANQLISEANHQFQTLLGTIFAEINRARETALADLRRTFGQLNEILEARINQVAMLVMQLLKQTTDALANLDLESALAQIADTVFGAIATQIERLEAMLLRDAAVLLDQVDAIVSGNLDDIRKRDIYAQLQASAVVMRRIVRGAPQAKDLYLRDWLKYGQLYQAIA
jgi:hypothetical protein